MCKTRLGPWGSLLPGVGTEHRRLLRGMRGNERISLINVGYPAVSVLILLHPSCSYDPFALQNLSLFLSQVSSAAVVGSIVLYFGTNPLACYLGLASLITYVCLYTPLKVSLKFTSRPSSPDSCMSAL